MFRTKKGKIVAAAVLIITFLAGALCTYVLLSGRSGTAGDGTPEEKNVFEALSGQETGSFSASAGQESNGSSDSLKEETGNFPASGADNMDSSFVPDEDEAGGSPDSPENGSPNGSFDLLPENGDAAGSLDTSPDKENAAASGQTEGLSPGDSEVSGENSTPEPLPTEDPAASSGREPSSAADPASGENSASPLPTITLPGIQTTNPPAAPTQTAEPAKVSEKTPTPAPTTAPAKTPTPNPAPSAAKSGLDGSVSANGQLKVVGTQLSNASGSPIVLRGVSTHGIAWFPDFATKAFMQTLRDEWGATVFRVAMYSYEGNDSYINNPSWNKAKVCGLIDAAIELDMYIIVDWHILADGNPQTYQKQAAEFFTYIASTYPGVPNILYEICNEPNGGAGWSSNIKPYANEIIPVIRKYSPDAVILVGTPTWSQDVDTAATDPLSFDNVMYSLHFYAGTHKESLRSKADTALAKGLPIFVTEWGTTDASGNGTVDKASSDEWLAYLEKNQISWCNWSLCNKSESSALLLPSATSEGTMPDSVLSESGKYIKAKMLEYSGTTPVENKPQDSTEASGQKTTPTPAPSPSVPTAPGETGDPGSDQKPSASDKTGLTLLYYNENREDSTNTISPHFQIKNNSESDISLDNISILYYYTPEKDIAQCLFCDYAEINGVSYRAITSDVSGSFVSGADSCMKITFSSGAGTLSPGDTATLQVRITNEDWSNYIQSNDASFLPDATTYTESSKAVLLAK